MCIRNFIVVLFLLSNHCLSAPNGYFYSTHGWFNNTCEVTACVNTCGTGLYLAGCEGNSTGACESCNNRPEFSVYTDHGSLVSDCAWSCDAGYTRLADNCVSSSCLNSIPLHSSYSNSDCDHQCDAGYFGAQATNPVSCNTCSAGSYSSQGATICTLCPAGTYSSLSASQGLVNCGECTAGTYSGSAGATISTDCVKCQAGTYSATPGASSSSTCLECPEGSSSAVTGANRASLCLLCSAGKFTDTTGKTACGNCDAGTYAANTGTTKCAACAPNTFSSTMGAVACSACQYCTAAGLYKSSCGPVSPGSCVNCGSV